jgi:hypothetical protein
MRHGTVILLLVLGVVIGVPLVGWPQPYTFTTTRGTWSALGSSQAGP